MTGIVALRWTHSVRQLDRDWNGWSRLHFGRDIARCWAQVDTCRGGKRIRERKAVACSAHTFLQQRLGTTYVKHVTMFTRPGSALAAVKAGLPAFLVDDDDTDAAAARPAGPSGDHEEPHGSALAPVAAVSGTQRLLRLGFLGRPNAGKSTLVNRLAGGTVSAVSVRTETTRRPVLGALTLGDTQVCSDIQPCACTLARARQGLRPA